MGLLVEPIHLKSIAPLFLPSVIRLFFILIGVWLIVIIIELSSSRVADESLIIKELNNGSKEEKDSTKIH